MQCAMWHGGYASGLLAISTFWEWIILILNIYWIAIFTKLCVSIFCFEEQIYEHCNCFSPVSSIIIVICVSWSSSRFMANVHMFFPLQVRLKDEATNKISKFKQTNAQHIDNVWVRWNVSNGRMKWGSELRRWWERQQQHWTITQNDFVLKFERTNKSVSWNIKKNTETYVIIIITCMEYICINIVRYYYKFFSLLSLMSVIQKMHFLISSSRFDWLLKFSLNCVQYWNLQVVSAVNETEKYVIERQ